MKVLAIGTSAERASSLSSRGCNVLQPLGIEFSVISLEDENFAESPTLNRLDYDTVLLNCSTCEPVKNEIRDWLFRWTTVRRHTQTKPVLLCTLEDANREEPLNGAPLNEGSGWKKCIDDLEAFGSAEVLWDYYTSAEGRQLSRR